MRRRTAAWLACLALGLIPGAGQAHSVGQSSLRLAFDGAAARAEWRIVARDLDALLGLDDDYDRSVSAGELARASAVIASYLLDRIEIEADAAACTTAARDSSLDGAYLRFSFEVSCPQLPRRLWLRYDLFFDHDPAHTAQISLERQGHRSTAVLTAATRRRAFELDRDDRWRQAREYLAQGIWHIWLGYDHVLFLLTLLLPAVLVRRPGGWEPAPRFGSAWSEVVKVVSAFTLAHSLTLSLATLGVVHLPARAVEATIAGSVCVAALNNLYAWVTRRLWLVACGFGLIHGFGFASVLAELGLPKQALLAALVAFNAGVELGQLAIVLLFLPLAFTARRARWYVLAGLHLGSLVIAGLGAVWLIERALGSSLSQTFELLSSTRALPALWPVGVGLVLALALAFGQRKGGSTRLAALVWLVSAASAGYAIRVVHAQRSELQRELAGELDAAQAALARRQWSRAGARLARADRLAAAVGDRRAEAAIASQSGALHTARADLRGARAAHERALMLYEALGDDRSAAASQRALGLLATLRSDIALAARAYRRALALHQRVGLDAEAARDAAQLAVIYRRTKQYSEAQAMYAQALAIHEARGDHGQVAALSAELGHLQQIQARHAQAAVWFERAAQLHERAADSGRAAGQYANLASAQRAQGKLDEAARTYRRSLALFRQAGAGGPAHRVESLLAELGSRTGEDIAEPARPRAEFAD